MGLQEKINNIPAAEVLAERYSFINDETLRTNVAISLQYIVFLRILCKDIKGPIVYSLYKDVILNTACIVEGCLHYGLRELIKGGKANSGDVMPAEWKDGEIKVDIYEISETEKIVGVLRKKTSEKLTSNTKFQTLIKASKKAGLIDNDLAERVDLLRDQRNNIHLAGLTGVEDYYSEVDIEKAFVTAKQVVESVERAMATI